MDITDALAPASDQLDAVELVNPRTFTIDTGSRLGKRDGRTVVEIRLVNFDRVWRPSKGMLDVLAACWGTDGKAWVGRRVTLYNDRDVTFGKEKTGGIRISHLSHIEKARTVAIRAPGAGRVKQWHVEPLPDEPTTADPTPEQIASLTDEDALKELWKQSSPQGRRLIEARVAELRATPAADPETGEVVEGELFGTES
ncbi:hypothetical protein SAMN06309944_0222 [Micrococcales bacterium KH10]|nr:hypothetical protein SAMN06309944_0222 [Micrococcales bacterium KH10]